VAADIGLPGAGPRVVEQVRALAKEIRDHKLSIFPNCAARTLIADIEPIVRIAEEVGIKIEAATFIGSSPIRQYTEDWTLDKILASTEEAVTFATKAGLPVMYVTEDTTRARPETLRALYGAAINCGATRICLADTVGHATPDGVRSLVQFVKKEIVGEKDVRIDWHGHRDRGMGLINCLAAIEAGVDRVPATALGVGERVGSDATEPPAEYGLEQKIEISPVSGLSNVKYWLQTHGYDPEDEAACRALFDAAKRTDRVLSDDDCRRLLKQAAWR